ncbi:hypothetical protein [Neisseria lactamica]|uniref:hypothetical protein n=1 Tax=Neisseria lactamica TaxID=486 RepID=UPI0013053520|nr:hypothetical protein [Neisseria lactamica]
MPSEKKREPFGSRFFSIATKDHSMTEVPSSSTVIFPSPSSNCCIGSLEIFYIIFLFT